MAGEVQDVDQKAVVEQQRRDFPKLFKNVSSAAGENVPIIADPLASSTAIGRRRGEMDEETIQYLNKMLSIENRLNQTGVHAATILNLNPWPLKVNSTLLDDIEVPACPKGRPYLAYVIKKVRFSRKDEPDGNDTPMEWHPIQQAREFNSAHYNKGGVVIYVGDAETEDPATRLQKDAELKRNFDEARERQINYLRVQVNEATGWFNSPNANEKKAINNLHRDMAMLLHDLTGEELPAWVNKTPGKYGLGEKCPACSAIPSSTAVRCSACGYVLNPQQAFENGDIEIDDPAMKRLDRKTLEAMGISELIEETIEERNAALRKKAEQARKAKAKPATAKPPEQK